MSLSRALGSRRAKGAMEVENPGFYSQPSDLVKRPMDELRDKISGPIELIHTTNLLVYTAPDIYPGTTSSILYSRTLSPLSARSEEGWSDSNLNQNYTPPTSPEEMSIPGKLSSPGKNHLTASKQTPTVLRKSSSLLTKSLAKNEKRSHDPTAEQNRNNPRTSSGSRLTLSTKASFTFSRSSSTSTTTSATSGSLSSAASVLNKKKLANSSAPTVTHPLPTISATLASQPHLKEPAHCSSGPHPFGPELAQVSEVAEEFGIKGKLNIVDREERDMAAAGLLKYTADEYLFEIRGLLRMVFAEPEPDMGGWI